MTAIQIMVPFQQRMLDWYRWIMLRSSSQEVYLQQSLIQQRDKTSPINSTQPWKETPADKTLVDRGTSLIRQPSKRWKTRLSNSDCLTDKKKEDQWTAAQKSEFAAIFSTTVHTCCPNSAQLIENPRPSGYALPQSSLSPPRLHKWWCLAY